MSGGACNALAAARAESISEEVGAGKTDVELGNDDDEDVVVAVPVVAGWRTIFKKPKKYQYTKVISPSPPIDA